jgi:hypothetical protein
MAAMLIEIADALVGALAGASYSQPVAAVRKYRADYQIKDLEGSVVTTVIPRSIASVPASRTGCQYDHTLDVAIQHKISGSDEDLDAMLGLVDEIEKSLRLQSLTTTSSHRAAWTGTTSDAAYDLKHLDELRVFTAVLSLTYRIIE